MVPMTFPKLPNYGNNRTCKQIIARSFYIKCIKNEKFRNFGWETLYANNQSKVLKIIDMCDDAYLLFILVRLELLNFNAIDVYAELSTSKLPQDPMAIKIANYLKDVIPNADPIYLALAGEMFAYNSDGLTDFIEQISSGKKTIYPKLSTYKECIKNIQLVKNLTINFSPRSFIRQCPDPVNYFIKINTASNNQFNDDKLNYLIDRFFKIPKPIIRNEFISRNYDLIATVDALEVVSQKSKNCLRKGRKPWSTGYVIFFGEKDNIDFLKEIAYVENREAVQFHIETDYYLRVSEVEKAMEMDLLYKCECCYATDLLQDEVSCCPKGHSFCLECIKKFVEIEVGLKKLEFQCLATCTENFHLEMLKEIVDEKLYARLLRLKQAEDIKAANIEGLETCAFCDYSAIVSQDLKIFSCLNPECGKEICRICREENHVPLKCNEIEKTPELQIRTMIENKMSAVLIRVCPTCGNKFLKESGCNRIVCTCGTHICYICKNILSGFYDHFYHLGPIPDRCPLYTDENLIHVAVIEAAARLIINELKETKPELLNKVDLNKLLPEIINKKPAVRRRGGHGTPSTSVVIENEVIAKILGEDVEKINQLSDMREFPSRQPKRPRVD
ncbi:Hypothetical protein CINCED_3A016054 [Cinara cedri]|uniref:RING-type domain-containing protein n=1 Tax=Cinara cedri TaxID=506608 RepID=A0A5E4NCR7_9HEMI|nr:Hypothetical protein CINCED_3A016054 [Cinara cedri]